MNARRMRASLAAACCAIPLSLAAQTPPRFPEERVADSLFAAKNFERAYDAYSALARRDSSVVKYWHQLGMSAANLKRYDRGVAAFQRAASITPNPVASYNVAAMFARLGRTDSAFFWLDRAVRTGFSDENTLRTDDDLASIRADKRFETVVFNATHAPTPCANDPERRRFDFWAGEWDVTNQAGQPAGKSSIQIINGGCALLENWTNRRGGTGKSLNSYNPATSRWQQYWVDQSGSVTEYRDSEWRDGKSLSFFARNAPPVNGKAVVLRLTFTPLNDSTVRQHGEQSTDGGATWTTTYDLLYHRRR